jgi:hypothetical protein
MICVNQTFFNRTFAKGFVMILISFMKMELDGSSSLILPRILPLILKYFRLYANKILLKIRSVKTLLILHNTKVGDFMH